MSFPVATDVFDCGILDEDVDTGRGATATV
jgi:hypothetical protein